MKRLNNTIVYEMGEDMTLPSFLYDFVNDYKENEGFYFRSQCIGFDKRRIAYAEKYTWGEWFIDEATYPQQKARVALVMKMSDEILLRLLTHKYGISLLDFNPTFYGIDEWYHPEYKVDPIFYRDWDYEYTKGMYKDPWKRTDRILHQRDCGEWKTIHANFNDKDKEYDFTNDKGELL